MGKRNARAARSQLRNGIKVAEIRNAELDSIAVNKAVRDHRRLARQNPGATKADARNHKSAAHSGRNGMFTPMFTHSPVTTGGVQIAMQPMRGPAYTERNMSLTRISGKRAGTTKLVRLP